MQRESAREDVDDIWEWMRVPGQSGVWCDGQLDRSKLRLTGGIMFVRLAVPRLRCLQQDFAVTAGNAIRPGLSEYRCQRCSGDEGGIPMLRYFELMSVVSIRLVAGPMLFVTQGLAICRCKLRARRCENHRR